MFDTFENIDAIQSLKFNLLESKYPYFNDLELQTLLKNNSNNILLASYKGCLMKAQADDGVKIGSLQTSSNREFWLSLAEEYLSDYQKTIIDTGESSGYYKNRLNRVDGQ